LTTPPVGAEFPCNLPTMEVPMEPPGFKAASIVA
jgi:hypothetical protein